jgi:RTX calcium-binding nonapeptide repeat (4 copies)
MRTHVLHRPVRRQSGPLVLTAALASLVLVVVSQATGLGQTAAVAAASPVTYPDHVYAAAAANPPSADKPQSKLWFNDGSWWAVMLGGSSVNIYQLGADHVWHDTGTVVDPRVTSTADVLWTGSKLYVASRTGGPTGKIQLFRYSYSVATDSYSRDNGFPVTVGGAGGSESVTVDRDSVGHLWVTFTRNAVVWVAHSTSSDRAWVDPFRIPGIDTDVSADDISSLISMGNEVGVLWSDQVSQVFRFAVHVDTDPDTDWSMEVAYSGTRIADDHMNLKSLLGDDGGRVYAAVKTSLGNDPVDPPDSASIVVLTRSSSGVWTNATAANRNLALSRPQLALDRTHHQLILLDSDEADGSVYYKTAPLGAVTDAAFNPASKGSKFITWPGALINNVSTSKQPFDSTSGLVAVATDSTAHRYYHAELSVTFPTPPPVATPPTSPLPPPVATPPTSPLPPPPTSPNPPNKPSPRPLIQPVTCDGLRATIIGTSGADRLVGTAGNDVIVAGAGADTIAARGGRDTICAGTGNDSVSGGTGNDRLFGGTGNDLLNGNTGSDAIDGQAGNDRVNGGKGRDLLRGGTGADTVNGGPGADTTHAGSGIDTCISPRLAAGCNR